MSRVSTYSGWRSRATPYLKDDTRPNPYQDDFILAIRVNSPTRNRPILAVFQHHDLSISRENGCRVLVKGPAQGVAVDSSGQMVRLTQRDYDGLVTLARDVDTSVYSITPEVPDCAIVRLRPSVPEAFAPTYELVVPLPPGNRAWVATGQTLLRRTCVYTSRNGPPGEEHRLIVALPDGTAALLPDAIVELIGLAEEARVEGDFDERVLRAVRDVLGYWRQSGHPEGSEAHEGDVAYMELVAAQGKTA